MSKFILCARLNSFKSQIGKTHYLKAQPNSKKTIVIVFGLIIITSVFYLWQTNNLATKGYKIKDLQDKVSDLRSANKKLELEITQLRSTERITKEVETLKMVEVARVEYLRSDGSSVALNR